MRRYTESDITLPDSPPCWFFSVLLSSNPKVHCRNWKKMVPDIKSWVRESNFLTRNKLILAVWLPFWGMAVSDTLYESTYNMVLHSQCLPYSPIAACYCILLHTWFGSYPKSLINYLFNFYPLQHCSCLDSLGSVTSLILFLSFLREFTEVTFVNLLVYFFSVMSCLDWYSSLSSVISLISSLVDLPWVSVI